MAPNPPLVQHQRPSGPAAPTASRPEAPKLVAVPQGPTPPDPRKLRRDVIMSLIETCPTRTARERADVLIADAEKLIAYITHGKRPDGEGA